MANALEKTFRIFGREVKLEKNNFTVWSYTNDGKTFYEVHFTKDCAVPSKPGYYLVTAKLTDINIKKAKIKSFTNPETGEITTLQPNDLMWIKSIISIVPDVEYTEEVEKKRIDFLNNLL